MLLSKKISCISPSETLAISKRAQDLKKSGKDVVSLCAGEPDFPTPQVIKEAAIKAINSNRTKYTVNPGIIELREAISQKLKKENNLFYPPEQIIVTNGAKQAIYNGFRSLINTGDEVLVPSPCWVSYIEQIKLGGGTPVLAFGATDKPLAQELEEKITDKTRLMVLNSPNNPVGYVYSREELIDIARLVKKYDLILISDEIYEKIIYDGLKHYSPPALVPEITENTLVINGFSKAFSMTGWRVGYAAGPAGMIGLLNRIQSHQTSNTCSISQYAALEALTNPAVEKDISHMVDTFSKRRDRTIELLKKLPGVTFYHPEGAFYILARVDSFYNQKIRTSLELCNWLLDEFYLALVPGSAFFREDHLRISYAASMEEIEKGISRLKEALGRLSK